MKPACLIVLVALVGLTRSAFGWVGGPYDNGDSGILNERGGFYQASMAFKNGSGYCIWTSDQLIGAQVTNNTVTLNYSSGSLQTPASDQAIVDHNGNRSVFYYKGVTYVGSAFGNIDLDKRDITGFCNAYSEFTVAQANTQQTNNIFFGQSSVTSATSSDVVSSGRSYVVNANFTAEIIATHPQMRFEGTGEMAVIAPNGRDTIASIAVDGYSSLVRAIATSVSQLFSERGQDAFGNVNVYQDGATAIDFALASLGPHLEGTGPDQSFAETLVEKMKVTGVRRFF